MSNATFDKVFGPYIHDQELLARFDGTGIEGIRLEREDKKSFNT